MGACRSAFSRNIVNENKPLFLSDHAHRPCPAAPLGDAAHVC